MGGWIVSQRIYDSKIEIRGAQIETKVEVGEYNVTYCQYIWTAGPMLLNKVMITDEEAVAAARAILKHFGEE